MDSWRQTFWLWTIILSLIASVVVCLIFILIHKCVFRKANVAEPCDDTEFYVKGSVYHPKELEEELPPLPPRTQFLSNSYESMTGIPEYVKVEEEASRLDTVSMDYDDIGEDKGSVGGEDYDDVG